MANQIFIRDDLPYALDHIRNIPNSDMEEYTKRFIEIYKRCCVYPDAEIVCMDVRQQIDMFDDRFTKGYIDQLPQSLVILDKFFYGKGYYSQHRLNVSRLYKIVNGVALFSHLYIDEAQLEDIVYSLKYRNHTHIMLVDDDICTGGTINTVKERFEKEGFTVTNSVGLANMCCEYYMIDCIDLRDFIPFAKHGGLMTEIEFVTTQNNHCPEIINNDLIVSNPAKTKVRLCYLDTRIDLVKQASIDISKVDEFRREVTKLNTMLRIGVLM